MPTNIEVNELKINKLSEATLSSMESTGQIQPNQIFVTDDDSFDGEMVDRVIETYTSSDGKTWYRKYASGWKECGINNFGEGLTWAKRTVTFPISFSNTNYNVQFSVRTPQGSGSYIDIHSGTYQDKTVSSIAVSCDNSWIIDIRCCGY